LIVLVDKARWERVIVNGIGGIDASTASWFVLGHFIASNLLFYARLLAVRTPPSTGIEID
jgi:hypothetical protein